MLSVSATLRPHRGIESAFWVLRRRIRIQTGLVLLCRGVRVLRYDRRTYPPIGALTSPIRQTLRLLGQPPGSAVYSRRLVPSSRLP